MADGTAGFAGDLTLRVNGKTHRVPGYVAAWLEELGHGAAILGSMFQTELHLAHYSPSPRGKHIAGIHFGDASHPLAGQPHHLVAEHTLTGGKITNAGANLLAADATNWIGAATPFSTLSAMNFHALGTSTTVDAQSDIVLGTFVGAGSLTGSTNGYMAGTQSWVIPNSTNPIYQTVATFTAAASIAVNEYGIFMANAAAVTGTATSVGNNTLTNTGATFATAGNGLKAYTLTDVNPATNTSTNRMAQIASNTATILTILGGSGASSYLTLANAGTTAPGGTTAYSVVPTMWDHKSGASDFPTINLVTSDTLAGTYRAGIVAGG